MKSVQLFVVALLMLAGTLSSAQKIVPDGEPIKVKKVACWPPIFVEGDEITKNETAPKTARETVQTIFQKLGMEWIDEGKVNGVASKLGLAFDKSTKEMPTPAQMLKLGRELGVDYVLAYRCSWRIKSIWVGLGPKTKAWCKTKVVIIDVAKEVVVYNPDEYEADSTKKESPGETAAALFVSFGFTALSGGPKTPHMQRSGQVSIVHALDGWVRALMPERDNKIIDSN